MRKLIRLYQKFIQTKWTVGFIDFDENRLLDSDTRLNIKWIRNNPENGWFADPFILSLDEDYVYLLVEEFVYGQRGRISKVKVNRRNLRYEEIIPLISLSTHLSFPAWFKREGKIYIYPESSHSGKLTLYEYDIEKEETKPICDLSQLPLVDATICEIDGKKYIAATVPPDENGHTLELFPYNEDNYCGKYEPGYKITFDDRIGRNAGAMFRIGGRLFRPAQKYGETYGECVVLQEIIPSKEGINSREIRRIYSDNQEYGIGLHTFNVFENKLIVVDGRGYRWPFGAILKRIIKIIR